MRVPRFGHLVAAATVALGVVVGSATAIGANAGALPAGDDAPGSIVIAAEEEPATADWIHRDAGVAWGVWALGIHTLPQAFVVQPDGSYAPGAVLAGEPELDPGPPQRVTYRIRDDAVWSDGAPITSKDFSYLWKQVTKGRAISDRTGYADIASVDTTDPKVAVVTFEEPYAAWRDLFGGFYFLLPSHLLEGKNRHDAMKDGYAFSGGPWKLKGGARGWKQGRSLSLVPNERYWGTKPSIGEVTFQFIPETGPAIQAVKTGQVDAAYPTPDVGILDELEEEPSLESDSSLGNTYEALWLNTATRPLDSRAVRQALAYATDRDAIVEQVLTPAVRRGAVLQSFNVPTYQQYFTPSFERYTRNVDRVNELMTGDGWTRGDDGVWAKNGRRARVELNTTKDVGGREIVERLLKSQWEDAGFQVTIDNADPGTLFGDWLPNGTFSVGIFSSVGSPDPDLCILFCTSAIPTDENGGSGLNITYLSSPAIDGPLTAQLREPDAVTRAPLVRQGQDALADEVPAIPLYQAPTVFVWNTDRIGGPLADNTTSGPFYNLNEWTLR